MGITYYIQFIPARPLRSSWILTGAPVPESIDIEQPDQLVAYLEHGGHIDPGEPIIAHVLTGGVSNRTVLVERPNGEPTGDLRSLVTRGRPCTLQKH